MAIDAVSGTSSTLPVSVLEAVGSNLPKDDSPRVGGEAGDMTKNESTPAAAAGTWKLGRYEVNRMGFGSMRLGTDVDRAVDVLRKAVELGVNHIDTAAFYGTPPLSSNDLINRALRPYADNLVLTTKVGPSRDENGEFQPEGTPEQLRGHVEDNLRRLGRDHIEVVNLRIGTGIDRGTGSIAERFGALAELRQEGLIGELGLSNIGPEHLAEAQAIAPVVCVQNLYGLAARREDDELVRLCREQGVAFVPFFAVTSATEGVLDDVIARIAQAHDASAAQVRLAWTLHQGPHVLAIPGTGDPAHLEENVAAAGLHLTETELTALNTA
jgi:aryl-alcohol dehydrogenase-like predicted oxidoreductase